MGAPPPDGPPRYGHRVLMRACRAMDPQPGMPMEEQARRESELRDREAPKYEERFSVYQHRCEEQDLRRFLASRRWERVLDLGCGTERFVDALRETETTAIGLDISFESLRNGELRSEDAYALVQGAALRLPFGADTFNAAFSVQVLEHFATPSLRQVLFRQVDRVLAPGGSAYLSTYGMHVYYKILGRVTYRIGDHHFERLSPGRLRAELVEGFPGWRARTRSQCLFLRHGTRFLRRLPSGIEDSLRFRRLGGWIASFAIAHVDKAPGHGGC